MPFLTHLLFSLCYQPFANLLVWLQSLLPSNASFGWTVILVAVVIKLFTSPYLLERSLSLSQREALAKAIEDIDARYAKDPDMRRKLTRHLINENRFSVFVSGFIFVIQLLVGIAILELFANDLFHTDRFLYSYMTQPDSIVSKFLWADLTQPNFIFAIIASITLLLQLTSNQLLAGIGFGRNDKFLQYAVPVAAYIILIQTPAALSLFVFTNAFTTLLTLFGYQTIRGFGAKPSQADTDEFDKLFPQESVPPKL